MSKHLSKKQTREIKSGKSFSIPRLYPAYEYDAEGYCAGLKDLMILGVSALLLAGALLFRANFAAYAALCALSFIAVGLSCFRNLAFNFSRGRILCEALLITLACGAEAAAGAFAAAAAGMLFYSLAMTVLAKCTNSRQSAAGEMLNILPAYATLLEDGETMRIRPSHIREGDLIAVGRNEVIPMDGVVVEGMSSADASSIIRSKKIIPLRPGSAVCGGSLNLTGEIVVRAGCDYQDSTAQKIFSGFTDAISERSSCERRGENFFNALALLGIVLFVIIAGFVPIFKGEWLAHLKKGAGVLLCACPFGLISSLALAVFTGVSRIFSAGGVIRSGKTFAKLAAAEAFVCNKTGTVTHGEYTVLEAFPVGIGEENFLSLLGKVESGSEHPIARAIRRYTGTPDGTVVPGMTFEEIPTKGISAVINSSTVYAGNASLLFEHGINCIVPEKNGPAVHLAVNGRYCGYVILDNRTRSGVWESIETMKSCGAQNFAMLSGDLHSIVRQIAATGNFNIVKAELTPEGKASAVAYIKSNSEKNGTVIFASDGLADAEAASAADVSVATAAFGIPEALTARDMAVFAEGISVIPEAVKAASAADKASRYALVFALAARGLFLLLALLGAAPFWVIAAVLGIGAAGSTIMCSYESERR